MNTLTQNEKNSLEDVFGVINTNQNIFKKIRKYFFSLFEKLLKKVIK